MKALRRLAMAAIVLGVILLVYMVVVEGEPGAVPLALIAAGGLCLWLGRRRT